MSGLLNAGSVVTAVATKGSIAIGSDTSAPTCTPKNGGMAKGQEPDGELRLSAANELFAWNCHGNITRGSSGEGE
jgi:hypothetical protein